MKKTKRTDMVKINSEALRNFIKSNHISIQKMATHCGCAGRTIYKAFAEGKISKYLLTKMLEYCYLTTGVEVRECMFMLPEHKPAEETNDAMHDIAVMLLKLKADEKRIETLEAFLRMPWYKRLFYRKEIVNE